MNGKAVRLLSVYSAKAWLVLMADQGGRKIQEITAILELLSCLDLTGTVVTIDEATRKRSLKKSFRRKPIMCRH
ncbi:hypothetical protein [Methylobacter sp.]|uniref:hypothetical protein n=1 Tax=Methylobacter sp. TaxID=2051955 RepID=UPI00121A896D|nr:hypothetical protein [Methylobacter sp.]TAK62323.1 MAG: hypothetical protein EPO18_11010 [Methylobacter sp.]